MDDHSRDAVGVDISKTHLDACRLDGEAKRFVNDAEGFEDFAAWVGASDAVVVYESTGHCHRDFEEALAGRLRLARVNAARARRFAQALGEEAKTDAADARVLAAMGEALRLRQVEARSSAQRDLDELGTARDGLVKDRVAALNRQKHVRHKLLKQQNRNRLAQIERQLKAVDAEIDRLLGAPELARRAEVLGSIPGVGPVTVAGLIAEMPELGALDAKAAACLAGLAPMARESGNWKGRSYIKGGRQRVLRLLYMAAVSAIRHNPDLAAKYRQLVGRGKPPKVALVAVMRKLLLLANVLLRDDRLWTLRPGDQPDTPLADAAEDADGLPRLGEGSLGDRSQGAEGQPRASTASARPQSSAGIPPLPTPA